MWNIISDRFVGLGFNYQVFPELLTYFEGNIHTKSYTSDNLKSDALLGTQWNPKWSYFPIRFTSEYFLNSEGIRNKSETQRFYEIQNRALNPVNRSEAYLFPAPDSLNNPAWGTSSFLSRDILFFDIRNSVGSFIPYGTYLISLNDVSSLLINGFKIENLFQFFLNQTHTFQFEWRHYFGDNSTEFGQAALCNGEDQLWFTFSL